MNNCQSETRHSLITVGPLDDRNVGDVMTTQVAVPYTAKEILRAIAFLAIPAIIGVSYAYYYGFYN